MRDNSFLTWFLELQISGNWIADVCFFGCTFVVYSVYCSETHYHYFYSTAREREPSLPISHTALWVSWSGTTRNLSNMKFPSVKKSISLSSLCHLIDLWYTLHFINSWYVTNSFLTSPISEANRKQRLKRFSDILFKLVDGLLASSSSHLFSPTLLLGLSL